jgi:hypothetical protein
MGVKLQSALGGSVELNAPSTASNFTMTVPAGNGTVATTDQLANFRNRIINGDMRISQRGTSFPALVSSGYAVDRWRIFRQGDAVATLSRETDSPTGFSNSLRATITTADTSIASTDIYIMQQIIEGYNVADLVGQTFTLSFWVKSALTGTHCVSFSNASVDRTYLAEYSISVANTWEYKTVTVTGGIPSSGGWNFTNGNGLDIRWALMSGSAFQTAATNSWITGNFVATANQVNVTGATSRIFAIAGVQLEVGSVATTFERRPVGTELALCQRYYHNSALLGSSFPSGGSLVGFSAFDYNSGNILSSFIAYPVHMRVAPTVTTYDIANTSGKVNWAPDGGVAVSANTPNVESTVLGFFFIAGGMPTSSRGAGYFKYEARGEL